MQVEARTIGSIAGEWDRLADHVGSEPFLRPGWITAWWGAFGRGTLRVLATDTREGLTGVVPVLFDRRAVRSPSNAETPVFGFVADGDAAARRLAVALLSPPARRVDLSAIDSDDLGLIALEREARARRWRTIRRPVLLSPYVDTRGAWGDYEPTVDAKVRSEVRRRTRRLGELGELRLEIADGSERADTLLTEGFRLEESGWKGDYGTAINSSARTLRFYRDVARWAADRGWLRLAFLRLGDRPLAFDLCLESDRRHYLLKTGYDSAFQRFGPGTILRSKMLQRAFSEPIDSYEFLGTDVGANNDWKREWTARHHERLHVHAVPPSLAGTVEWSALTYGVDLTGRSRSLAVRALGPAGRHAVKRARRWLRQLVPA
jgi:CelD/BcsL family acetyltransferase involved in cellulose biosynthesis